MFLIYIYIQRNENNMMNDEIIILLLLKDTDIVEKNIHIFPMKEKNFKHALYKS